MTQNKQWILVSDVDDTVVGNEPALARFAQACSENSERLVIAYNSSRPCDSLRQTLAKYPHMPTPDYLIGALGTEIQKGESGEPLTDYTKYLDQNWHRDRIANLMAEMGFTPHAEEYQTPLKASYDVPDVEAYNRILSRLEEAGLKAKVIYSGGTNLDIIPESAGKGNVIKYLHQRLKIQADHVVVAGDSGNDIEMFVAPYRGIVVGNADADLKKQQGDHIYQAQATHADGVLEGLRFWGAL
jgi:sucrose-6F-phosphate phosphohydrolase